MAIGHCSTCAPAVAVHCMRLEAMGMQTAPIVTTAFVDLVKAVAFKAGMPELRFTFVPHPVGGKSAAELRDYGKAILEKIGGALTRPLSDAELKMGRQERLVPAEVYWDYQLVINYIEPLARNGVEPFASYLKTPAGGTIPRFAEAEKIAVLVVGGEKNAYWFATDFGYLKSESIDRWR